ncbi:MAG: PQQ-binding-like beta-propeller repeat protein [Myxococcota bacterium]|nr:PQQ-binding-like beta-propeller repeat protein [Myxococcota bacterium]
MPSLKRERSKGVIRPGWTASVDDYAIAGAWACQGQLVVVADAAGGVFGFDGRSGATRWSHTGAHEGGVLGMAVHPNGELVTTAGQDSQIAFWHAQSGDLIRKIDLEKGWVETLAWSPDGHFLAASNSRCVYVYRADGSEVWRSDDHPSTISSIAWSTSQELATACYSQVAFFSAASGEINQKLEWKGSLVSIALSPDGDIVACGSQDNSVHFWRRSTGQDSMMSGYPGKPAALAFDDTGILLATGGGEAVTVWSFQGDGPEGTKPGVLELHPESVTSLTFSPGTRTLASGARDGSVVVWTLKSDGEGQPVGVASLDDLVAGLAWRPDGRGLVALDARGGVTAFRMSH